MREQDLARIAAITRAYPRMRMAIISIAPAPLCIPFLRADFAGDLARSLVWLVALYVGFSLAGRFVPRLLDRRFGRLEPGTTRMVSSGIWGPPVPFWQTFGPLVGALTFGTMKGLDDVSLATGNPSVLMLVLAGVGLWLTAKDWPVRKHMVLFVVVCCAAAVILPRGIYSAEFAAWRTNAGAAAALAWMIVGLFDFLTLRRVLRPAIVGEAADAS